MNKIVNCRVQNADYSKKKSNLKLSKRGPSLTIPILKYLEEPSYLSVNLVQSMFTKLQNRL